MEELQYKMRLYKKGNYRLEVWEHDEYWETWIYHKDVKVKALLHGMPKVVGSREEPVQLTYERYLSLMLQNFEDDLEEFKEYYLYDVNVDDGL